MPAQPSTPSTTAQLEIHFGAPVVTPRGDGTFIVAPGKPLVGVEEIGTQAAADLLRVCRAQMWYIRNTPLGSEHLRWRFISDKKGKILWQKPSVLAYKEATENLGK